MKRYTLKVARIEEPNGIPLMFVEVPWEDFQHPLGATEYERVIAQCMSVSKVKYLGIAVSLSPDKQWYCDTKYLNHWARVTAATAAENLGWHPMHVEASESPSENMEKYRKQFPGMG